MMSPYLWRTSEWSYHSEIFSLETGVKQWSVRVCRIWWNFIEAENYNETCKKWNLLSCSIVQISSHSVRTTISQLRNSFFTSQKFDSWLFDTFKVLRYCISFFIYEGMCLCINLLLLIVLCRARVWNNGSFMEGASGWGWSPLWTSFASAGGSLR